MGAHSALNRGHSPNPFRVTLKGNPKGLRGGYKGVKGKEKDRKLAQKKK